MPILCIVFGLGSCEGSEGDSPWLLLAPCFIIFGVFFIAGAFAIMFGYKKKAFCVTNKRIKEIYDNYKETKQNKD